MRSPIVTVALFVVTACGAHSGGSPGPSSGAAVSGNGGTLAGSGTGSSVGGSGAGSGGSGVVATGGSDAGMGSGATTSGTSGSGSSGTLASTGTTGGLEAGLEAGSADGGDAATRTSTIDSGTNDSSTSGTGGTFVTCGDHADFNGQGLCPPTGKFGAVVATQTLMDVGSAVSTLTASFAASKAAIEPGCTVEAVGGACTASTCARTGNAATEPQAGTIAAKSSGGFITIAPDAMGNYAGGLLASALWTLPKSALTFTAAGGVIPSFSDTFCGPVSATITAPAMAPGSGAGRGLGVDRSTALAMQWTGGAVGDLEIAITDDSAAAARVEVQCFFPGASGQGTVPVAALAKISAGTHAMESSMWVRKISLPTGTCVELTGVVTNVTSVGGISFNGDATFR